MRLSATLVVFFAIPAVVFSATLTVPGDYPTIQEAIDAALDGDTVLVLPGTYVENIDFLGKAIAVRSSDGPEGTVIDGNQVGAVVRFITDEGPDSVLDGFTITNGTGIPVPEGWISGGGIFCNGSSPAIVNNIIYGNEASGHGGGIACLNGSSPKITYNVISENMNGSGPTPGWGGGIGCSNSSPAITHNIISKNQVTRGGGGIFCKYCTSGDLVIYGNTICENESEMRGGGIYVSVSQSIDIVNNILYGNKSPTGGGIHYAGSQLGNVTNNTLFDNSAMNAPGWGGGIFCNSGASLTVTNTILWNNSALSGSEIYIGNESKPSTLTISHSDVEGGQASVFVEPYCTLNWGTGMIEDNPLFLDPAGYDFHILYGSPCRDSGDNAASGLLDEDFEGDPRTGSYDGFAGIADIGADDFFIHLHGKGDATPGGTIQIEFMGKPETLPVGLWIGLAVLETPIETSYGDWWNDWWLDFSAPLTGPILLDPIPSVGVELLAGTLPPAPPGPYSLHMQAMIGDSLTNLSTLNVKQ